MKRDPEFSRETRDADYPKRNFSADRLSTFLEPKRNIQTEHTLKKSSRAEKKYSCDLCDFSVSNFLNLKLHNEIQHGRRYSRDELIPVVSNVLGNGSSGVNLAYSCQTFNSGHYDYIFPAKINLYHRIESNHIKTYACDKCDNSSPHLSDLKRHNCVKYSSKRYPCDQCDHISTLLSGLKRHKDVKHLGINYPCDKCDNVACRPSLLQRHKVSTHLGKRYPCDQCDFESTRLFDLIQHKNKNHLVIKYPCDQCDYIATRPDHLKRHKVTIHLGIRYPCDKCEHTFTRLSNLKRHKDSKHSQS